MKIPEGYSQEPMENPPVIHYDQLEFRFIPSDNDNRTRIQLFPPPDYHLNRSFHVPSWTYLWTTRGYGN